MEDLDWQQVEAYFNQALEMNSADRDAFIDEVCGTNSKLREALEQLLANHEDSWTFMDQMGDPMSMHQQFTPEWIEQQELPTYKVIKPLGHGGMGAVYLAERDDQIFEKKVAIKFLRFDLNTQSSHRRFLAERQILATLEHPNIARLLDGGATTSGTPYLVMEYIDGPPIDKYCDQECLSIRERISLVLQLCEAVQHAHQNLIVHRDIKPANILVDKNGTPKLLDFGIAKLLDANAFPTFNEVTATQRKVFTPNFASPEQVFGEPITTASDVYSLGILLYLLLTGRRPHRFDTFTSLTKMQEIYDTTLPPYPSQTIHKDNEDEFSLTAEVLAQRRSSTPVKLTRALAGDLDQIALKALRREPHLRYPSVVQFSEDLHRYLDGLPVMARTGSWRYRTGKLIKKHKAGFALTAITALFLMMFALLSYRQAIRVAKERDVAQEVTRVLINAFETADPGQAQGRSFTPEDILNRLAQSIPEEDLGNPALRAQLMSAIGEVYMNLGYYQKAGPLLNSALEIRLDLHGANHLLTAESQHSIARLYYLQGHYKPAKETIEKAIEVRRKMISSPVLASSIALHAAIAGGQGFRRESAEIYEEALSIARNFSEQDPQLITQILSGLGRMRNLLRESELAIPLSEEALDMQRIHQPGPHPKTSQILRNLYDAYYRSGKGAKAEPILEECFVMNQKLYRDGHPLVAQNYHDLAKLRVMFDDHETAVALYRECIAMKRDLLGPTHPSLAGSLNNLAVVYHQAFDNLVESEHLLREALSIHHKNLGEKSVNLAFLNLRYGSILRDLGWFDQAEVHLCRSIELFYAYAASPARRVAEAELNLAKLHWMRSEWAQAQNYLTKAGPILAVKYPKGHSLNKELIILTEKISNKRLHGKH